MISLSRNRRAIIAMLCLPIPLAGCMRVPEVEMTPEQSRQVLITEANAIIRAVFPDAEPLVAVQVKDSPCGGPVGTEHTSVKSAINVHSDATDKDLNPDDVFQQVLTVLRQRGWTINYSRTRVAGAERAGVGGISAGVGESPVGINIFGDTECVKNPERAT
ncbi:hypothetical protein OHB01_17665 [Microbispora hainanensis]|uniref:hypothetical protein n=1 Tax=Microbispora hainanensis TaxID=568844 RepID=UPI002E2BBF6C|nr:hypothetical protein [Microbispora hainanensis]